MNNILKEGLSRPLRQYKLIIYLWVMNLLFSLIIVFPYFLFMKSWFGGSMSGELMLQKFSPLWLTDLVHLLKPFTLFISALIFILIILYLILQIFIKGGIIGVLNDFQEDISLQNFFGYCGKYFGRFLRLFLISIPVYLIAIGIPAAIISKVGLVFTKEALNAWPSFILYDVKLLAYIIIFTIINMVFDYAKIRVVATGNKSTLKETWSALKFVFRNFFKAWGIYWLLVLFFATGVFAYMEIEQALPANHLIFILIVFVLQQVFFLFRLWIKTVFYASQIEFYKWHVTI